MQPRQQSRARRVQTEKYRARPDQPAHHVQAFDHHTRQNGWMSDNRPTRYHPYAKHAVFYLALFVAEAALLGEQLQTGATDDWPIWKIVSVLLANLFFALMAGNHHISRFSKHLAARLVLAGLCLLILVALTTLIAPTLSGLRITVYAWLCALLVNALHYYPSRHIKAKKCG
jgi:hypothetical protein